MTNELKPCPFCGGETEWWQQFGWDREPLGYMAGCCSCGIQTWICDTKEQAIEAWNKRAEPQKVAVANVTFTQEQIDEIKEYCLRNLSRYTPVEVVEE